MTERPGGQARIAVSGPGTAPTSATGRPRDQALDRAILAAAEDQLRGLGYAVMSMESIARAARTTVPSVRRRYSDKSDLAGAVIDSMRISPLADGGGTPRERALVILENFRRNLSRPHSMALLGTLLTEEDRHPELLERFRDRLVGPRRALLASAVSDGLDTGELPAATDVDAVVGMLVGSFYATYVANGHVPRDWPSRVMSQLWPEA
jgi:AcrR family transcriptional regulator